MASSSKRPNFFWGVDCGSSAIKVALCDGSGNLMHETKTKTLFPLMDHVCKAIESSGFPVSPFELGERKINEKHAVVATGTGRHHVSFADERLTEIKAHFMGVQKQAALSGAYTIIDIGGQDAKVIQIGDQSIQNFVINRKCAAGTGAFIEELAHRLEINLEDLTELAGKHDKELSLSSYCTVFAVQEMIKILVSGERVENLVYALYRSVVKRILEMAKVDSDEIIFSGGVVSHHPMLLELFQEKLEDKKVTVAPKAQFCGALGAALYGLETMK